VYYWKKSSFYLAESSDALQENRRFNYESYKALTFTVTIFLGIPPWFQWIKSMIFVTWYPGNHQSKEIAQKLAKSVASEKRGHVTKQNDDDASEK